jgi:hypothetical protein
VGEQRYSSIIHDFGTRWRWVVSFMPWPLYSQGKSPQYPLHRILGGPQSQSGHCAVEKTLLPCQESNPAHPACCLSLYWLSNPRIFISGLGAEFKENETALENVFQDAERYLTLLIPTPVLAFFIRWWLLVLGVTKLFAIILPFCKNMGSALNGYNFKFDLYCGKNTSTVDGD